MSNLTTRAGKGSPLTNNELDANFTNLNSDKVEVGGDLSGTASAPNVAKIQGRAVSTDAPAAGEKLVWSGTAWEPSTDPSGEPIGHADKTQSSISFSNATRTFTIAPTGADFVVWCKGVKYTFASAQTVVIPNTTGLHYIYFDASGVLSTQMSYFTWEEHAPTAYIYWNATTSTAIYFGDERHGVTLDWQTHEYLHRTRGAAIASGFGASNYTTTGTGATDADAQIDIGGGTFFDEDMQIDVVSTNSPAANTWQQDLSGPARIPVLYLSGSAWVIDAPTDFPFKVVSGVPQYNLYSGGTWSTANVANNEYHVSWILATNNLNYPVVSIISQAATNQVSQAEAMTFEGLSLSGFPSVEFRPLYKVIYQHKTSFANSVKVSTIAVYDLRSLQSAGVAAALVQDHGNLSGLGDDDHAQYLHVSEVRTPSSAVKNSFLPSQGSNSGKYLTTDGTNPSWGAIPSGSLTFTGDVTGSGSTGSSVALTLANSGVTAGTYSKVTVDGKGRVTVGANIASGDVTTALGFTPENVSNKAVAGGYASLDGSGKVPSNQLPSYVDDVLEYANLAAFPGTGETGKIYIAIDTAKTYRWSGSAYVEISPSPGSTDSVTEGSTNLYFTTARARASVTASGSLSYSTSTGIFSYTTPNSDGITEGSTNLYFTNARARAAVSAAGSLSYNSSTGVFSFTDAVTSVAGRTGAVTLTSSDVGLGNVENKSSATIRGELTSGNVTTALGYTPYNSTNPSGYITSSGSISGNAATATTASNSTNLGGNAASYYDHRAYNVANNYLGAYYVGSGTEKPNDTIFGAGKLKIAMLNSSNLGFGGAWNDVLWISTYTGGDVKGSNALVFDKYSDEIYFSRQNYDSASWGTGRRILHAGNYSSYALPLSGGTLTGVTLVKRNLGTNDYTNVGQHNLHLRLQRSSDLKTLELGVLDNGTGVIQANEAGVGYNTLALNPVSGSVTINGNAALHAGNYSSYALPLSGGTVSGNTVFTTSLTANTGITVNAASGSGYGINLYSGSSYQPTYGLFFATTGNFGTYGAVSADWATYFTMNSTANRGWIFREVESLGNVAAISNQGNMTLRSHFEQGNNIARPNVSWSASGTSTGMVIFYLPGTTSNYGMIHMVFDIYEYNGNTVSTVIVGGHNWSTNWYNIGANVIGSCAKSVRLGVKDGRFCVVFGTSGSTWEYGTIVLRKIHNGSFYDNIMDMVGNWSATQTTTESFTSITGDIRALRTPAQMEVSGILYGYNSVRSNIFYDTDNTGYYVDPASTSNLNTITWASTGSSGIIIGNGAATEVDVQYVASNGTWEVGFNNNYGANSWFWYRGGTGYRGGLDQNANLFIEGSARAPIFYDYNNTSYYCDPSSNSRLSVINCGDIYNVDGGWFRNYGATGIYNQSYGNHFYSDSQNYWNVSHGGASNGGIRFRDNHAGTIRGYVYADTGNNIGFLNSGGSWRARVVGDDYFLVDGSSARAPIFYDSNDTTYYVDANSTSLLYRLNTYYISNNYSASTDHPFGLYFDSALSTAYAIYRESGAWTNPFPDLRIAFHTGIKLGANQSYQGIRFYNDYDMSTQVMSVNNGSDPLGANNVYVNNSLQAGGSLRAPIFYDSNDTNYYLDPLSTSRVNQINPNYVSRLSSDYSSTYLYGISLRGYSDQYLWVDGSTSTTSLLLTCNWDWDRQVGFHWTPAASGSNGGTLRIGQLSKNSSSYNHTYTYMHMNGADRFYWDWNGVFMAYGDSRAPVFYEYGNTGYYLNLDSTTALRTVGSWRADSASWDGEFSGKIQYHSSYWYLQSANGWFFRNSGGSNVLTCDSSGNLTCNGNVTAYSDRRLKSNVTTLGFASKYLSLIDAKRFTWNESGKADIGFIAQDVEEAGLPEFVLETGGYDPNSEKNGETIKSLDYGRMVAVLWQAVKEQQSQIEAAVAEIKSLKERLQ